MKYKIVTKENVVEDAFYRLVNSYSHKSKNYRFFDGRTLQEVIDAAKTAKTPKEFDEAVGNTSWTTTLCDLCANLVPEWAEISTIENMPVVLCKECVNKLHTEFAPIAQRTEQRDSTP